MNREALTKIGDPIRMWRDREGHPKVSYYLVGNAGNPFGIAVFHFDNKLCTSAIVRGGSDGEILIEHYDDEHQSEEKELEHLFKLYRWAFE